MRGRRTIYTSLTGKPYVNGSGNDYTMSVPQTVHNSPIAAASDRAVTLVLKGHDEPFRLAMDIIGQVPVSYFEGPAGDEILRLARIIEVGRRVESGV
jgi:hypothetical protein